MDEPPAAPTPAPKKRSPAGRLLALLAVAAGLAAAGYFLYPTVKLAMSTVTTDDAFVNGHVTYLAPRITENVLEVRFDDNDFVRKGDLVVLLDPAMWDIRLAQAEAALATAKTAEVQALATARATVAQAKANRYKLGSTESDVKNQEAGLRAGVARLREAEAAEKLAKAEAERYTNLVAKGSVTREQADVRQTDYAQAQARTRAALEEVHRTRAGLELPEDPGGGKPLDDVPAGLDQKHSSVLAALGAFTLSLAEVGLPLPRFYTSPDEFIAEIRKTAPGGDIDALVAQTIDKAPGVETARAQVRQAEEVRNQAKLERSYCEVRAEIEGFVSNRNVNPGDRASQGQKLLAVRSFHDVWVDANFKETQLEPIRIGHPVDLYVDAYPGKVFKGRVSGFNPGTGSALSLFPAQNATGNFVKIVQRLPVRVDLVGGNPPETPLYIGLSVRPYVRVQDAPGGANAGQRLRGAFPRVDAAARPTRTP